MLTFLQLSISMGTEIMSEILQNIIRTETKSCESGGDVWSIFSLFDRSLRHGFPNSLEVGFVCLHYP